MQLINNKLFAFNQVNRDHWVRRQSGKLPKGARILDMGAGSCPYKKHFSNCIYQTQDFANLKANQLRDGRYGEIDYVCDATSIPVATASFDVVLCTEVLEHVPDPVAVTREMARVLRPGGRLLLTAPLGSGIHQEPYHFYGGYTPFWYEKFLGEAGFDNIHIEPNGGFYRHYAQESLRFLQMTRPLSRYLPGWISILGAPLWLLLAPLFGVALPLLCAFIDKFDRECHFTVGYHVSATRSERSVAA